jgi:DNA-binding NarL/FixJ family response regulator
VTAVAASTVLIIEDDWLVGNGLREMLRAAGLAVVGVASRRAQVEAIVRAAAPDLAIVDIHLGAGGDGVEVAEALLVPAGVRVVWSSAHADDATLARVREVPARGFLVKPFSERQLRAAIEVALGKDAWTATADAAVAEHLGKARRAIEALAGALGRAPEPAAPSAPRLDPGAALGGLTDRERAVVNELLLHRRVPAIAEHLGISAHTGRNHLKAIFAKLRVSSQQELLDRLVTRAPR